MRYQRHLLTVMLAALAPLATAVEPGDLRLAFEWYDPQFDLEFGASEFDLDFDHSFGARVSLSQPLDLLYGGHDIVAVISGGYHDARREETFGVDFLYQTFTGRAGIGYRADFGSAFTIDIYPYFGIGGVSIELGDQSDPNILLEGGLQVDVAATFGNGFQLGVGAGYNARFSDHTISGISTNVADLSPAGYAFLGFRF